MLRCTLLIFASDTDRKNESRSPSRDGAVRHRNRLYAFAVLVGLFVLLLNVPSIDAKSTSSLKSDTTGFGKQIDKMIKRAHKLQREDLSKALLVCDSIEKMLLIFDDSRRYCAFLATKGSVLMENGKELAALPLLSQSLQIASELKRTRTIRQITNLMSCAYLHMGVYDKALAYGLQYSTLSQQAGDSLHMKFAANNLGLLYYKLHDPQTAIKYYRRAISIGVNRNGDFTLGANLAFCLNALNLYDSAELTIRKLASAYEDAMGAQDSLLFHFSLGLTFENQKRYENALDELVKAQSWAIHKEDFRYQADILVVRGRIFSQQGKFLPAIRELRVAEKICHQNSLNQILLQVYLDLGTNYREVGNFRESTNVLGKSIELGKEIKGGELFMKIGALENDYTEKENLIRVQKNRDAYALKAKLVKTRTKIVYLVIATLVLLLSSYLFLLGYKRKKVLANDRLEHDISLRTRAVEDSLLESIRLRHQAIQEVNQITNEIRYILASLNGCLNLVRYSRPQSRLLIKTVTEKLSRFERIYSLFQ